MSKTTTSSIEKKNIMFRRNLAEYIVNPVLGFLPFVLYAILRRAMDDVGVSLIISFFVAVAGEFYFRVFSKKDILGVSFLISGLALLLTFIVWLFTRNLPISTNFYTVICQIFIIGLIKTLLVSKSYLLLTIFRRRRSQTKAMLDDLYFVISIIHTLMISLLLVILILHYLEQSIPSLVRLLRTTLYTIIPVGIILCTYIIYQVFRIKNLKMRLKQEEWLPIVTEEADVIGKIAKSVSVKMKNQHLHPVVRIALVSHNKIYLQKRENNRILDPGKLDYPFEKYVLFNHEIMVSANNIITKVMGKNLCTQPQFILRYIFENDTTRRLIILFVIKVDNEDAITRNEKMHGKFWTIKQIEDSFRDEIFSECFELEYEYLKNKILLEDNGSINSQNTNTAS